MRFVFIYLLLFISLTGRAQPSFSGLEHLFTVPKHYTVGYTQRPPVIDGNLSDKVWENAAWSDFFQDIEGSKRPSPRYHTHVKMLWDDSCIYIAAELEEPQVWASLKKHDEIIFYDNDFEVFIDPDNDTHQYFEIEVNAFNTLFDLFLPKPYRNYGNALISWDAPGIRSAVKIQGSLNDPSDIDQGWTIEMAVPFSAMTIGNHTHVPQDEALWRINFSRVEWDVEIKDGKYIKKKDKNGKALNEHNWVWSPQGIVNMHYPERWGYLRFSRDVRKVSAFILPYEEKQKQYLWLIYYRQQDYKKKNKRYALNLRTLGVETGKFLLDGKTNVLKLEATERQFTASIQNPDGGMITINNEGLVRENK